jgi:flavodoxin
MRHKRYSRTESSTGITAIATTIKEKAMFEVVYYSRSGNTQKVAEAIADELWTTAKNIQNVETLPEDAFIFLGSGCYGAVIVKEIDNFIERNRLQGRKIALFTTSAFGLGKELSIMEKHILDKGVIIAGRFNCFGQFLAMKKGHPDADELEEVRGFARLVAREEYPQIAELQPLAAAAVAAGQEARLIRK